MIRFLAYSDLHLHHYTSGLTLADVKAVEMEMLQLAIKLKVDFILFAGDRYVSRNPMYEVAVASDSSLKEISDSGIPWYGLVGNHCRLTKNDFKGHILNHVGLYPKDMPNIHVMDQRSIYGVHTQGGLVNIHAVPAGHDPAGFDLSSDAAFNICAFHATTIGSAFHNGTLAPTGLSVSSFDKRGFDVVVGGDNHTRQEINGLTSCRGFFLGAPCQHNWSDEGASRGFTLFTLIPGQTMPDPIFYPSSSPKFVKANWSVADMPTLMAAISSISGWENNIVKLTIGGPATILNDLDLSLWKNKLRDISKARTIDVKLNYDVLTQKTVSTVPVSDTEEWISFLATKVHDNTQIDVSYLEALGLKYINN
jgi:DNA repair exonuclease SbcCD nuclease subunit